MSDRPIRRKKNVEEGGEGIRRREEAVTDGPVGRKEGALSEGAGKAKDRPSGPKDGEKKGQEGDRSTLGDLAQLGGLLGGGQTRSSGGLGSLLGGGSGGGSGSGLGDLLGGSPSGGSQGGGSSSGGGSLLGGLLGGGQTGGTGNVSSGNGLNTGGGSGGGGGLLGGGSGGGRRGSCSRILLILVVIVVLIFLFRSCMGSGGSAGGGGIDLTQNTNTTNTAAVTQAPAADQSGTTGTTNAANVSEASGGQLSGMGGLSSLFGNTVSNSSGGWSANANTGQLNTSVAPGARPKRTQIFGNGQDKNTILVYMCGTDLESRSAMASRDLQEMLNASMTDSVTILVYTGGCSRWQNNVISSQTNQIYKISNGNLTCLEPNVGAKPMVDPATLTEFIRYGVQVAPANRYDLIFWDHGGGSESGYGYDEKYKNYGSMNLAGISKALSDAGATFDFIGFDACLMATIENALVVGKHADYLIASEETEPGVGWYYTDWLTKLSQDPSMPTLQIGQLIADSFTNACATTCYGQDTTLSVIDLAELEHTVPASMTAFAKSTTQMIQNKEYQTVSNARSSSREFAPSTKIDQVDLVHLALNMGTDEGKQLADSLLGAIKYNVTSSRMSNAYGVSVYFPYSRASKVDSMVRTYETIGMDAEYTRCIQQFASMGVAGQVASGGTNTGYGSLFGQLFGGGSSPSAGTGSSASGSGGADLISQLLSSYMSSDFSSVSGLTSDNTGFLGRSLDIDAAAEYIAENRFDPSNLVWQENGDGDRVIAMTDEQWSKLQKLQLNFFYDDGEGILDLGMDDIYDTDADDNLLEPQDRTWLSIEGQPVAYYSVRQSGTEDDYEIIGRVPVELNGEMANLILVFDPEHEDGYVAGAVYDYEDGETDTIAKGLFDGAFEGGSGDGVEWAALDTGCTIRFVCDSYDKEGNYEGTYYIGDPVETDAMSSLHVSNTDVGDGTVYAAYVVTDLYGEEYWTPFLEL